MKCKTFLFFLQFSHFTSSDKICKIKSWTINKTYCTNTGNYTTLVVDCSYSSINTNTSPVINWCWWVSGSQAKRDLMSGISFSQSCWSLSTAISCFVECFNQLRQYNGGLGQCFGPFSVLFIPNESPLSLKVSSIILQ